MEENFLQYIWANSLFENKTFTAVSGKSISVLDVGRLNRDSGPDFFNARVVVDGIEWAGNIEIHCSNSDWNRHRHQYDPAYDNVILSVVQVADVPVYTSKGREVETVELKFADRLYEEYLSMKKNRIMPGCRDSLKTVDPFIFQMVLQIMAVERLERKCKDIKMIWEQTAHDWEETFYRLVCKYWTGNVNAEPFYELAVQLPCRTLLRYTDRPKSLEALLLGCAGLLDNALDDDYVKDLKQEFRYLKNKHQLYVMKPEMWKFMRIRPVTFPTLRLALLASFLQKFQPLLSRILETSQIKEVFRLMDVEASAYWTTHYQPGCPVKAQKKRMGESLKRILLINAVIPFIFLYGKEQGEERLCDQAIEWLEECPPEDNYITRAWNCKPYVESALQSQALLEITKEYCDKQRCLECRLSTEILKHIE